MWLDTKQEANYSLKCTFPQLFKCHICVQRSQIIKEHFIKWEFAS